MKHWATMLIAAAIIAGSAGQADAQRATIEGTKATATEAENAEFEIDSDWAYDVEVEYFTEDITATAGDDYQSERWTICLEGSNDIDGASDGCEFGSGTDSETLWVLHYSDDVRESNETYRVVAKVLRWETGAVDADGLPVVRECGGDSCGRAIATGTIVDATPDPEPDVDGLVSFAAGTASVTEGGTVEMQVQIEPSEQGSRYPAASVEWATSDDGAVSGRDYQASSGTVSLPGCETACGVQTRTIRVRTLQDQVEEGNDERFMVELSSPTNAVLDNSGYIAVVSIVDDDENTPPYVNLTAATTRVAAGAQVRLESNASDKEGPVTLQWSGSGSWDSRTRTWVVWTAPSPPQESTYTLTVTVTDDDGAVSTDSIEITVAGRGADNQSPTVTLAADATEVNEGSSITLTATAADSDGSIRRYDWSGTGTFGSGTSQRTWTPPAVERSADHTVSVTVTDDDGATATDSISIHVVANQAPTVSLAASAYEVEAGAEVTLTATAADSDGTIAAYAWSGTNLSATDTTAVVAWTAPRPVNETAYTLRVTVTDDDGDTATDTVHMTVAARPPPANRPPTVTFWPVSTADEELNGGETARILADGLDPDGDRITYEWSSEGGKGSFSASLPVAPIFSGADLRDWTAPRLAAAETVTITVVVTDGRGGSDSDTIDIDVLAHSDPNVAPEVTVTASAPGDPTDPFDPGDSVSFTVSATDTGTLTYEWTGGGGGFGEIAANGSVTWTAPETVDETDYTLKLTVTDSEGLATTWTSDVYTVTATAPPDPPANVLPTITISPPRFDLAPGAELTVAVRASDSDGTIEEEEWFEGARNIRSVGAARVAEWRAPADAMVGSTTTLTVTVTDNRGGEASASSTITIVEPPADIDNAAPRVEVTASALRVAPSGKISLTATATDTDGTIAAYDWSGAGTFTARGTDARQDWTAPAPDEDADYELTVTVTDDDGAEATASITISVIGTTNTPPTVSLTSDIATALVGAGGRVVLTAVAEDRNGSIAKYEWTASPDAGRFELWTTAGKTSWFAPSPTQDTVYTLTVTVTDNDDATASDSVDITVKPGAEPEPEPEALPIVTFEPPDVAEGTTGYIQVRLDKAAPSGASVRYVIGDATEGVTTDQACRDYVHGEQVLNLSGMTSATVAIVALADTCHEGRETVTVRFTDPAKVRLDFDTVQVSILNRAAFMNLVIPPDATYTPNSNPTLAPTLDNIPIDEGASRTLTVRRETSNRALLVPAKIEAHLTSGRSTSGEDFDAGPYTITFAQGQTTATFTVTAHEDDVYGEPDEGFTVTLKNPSGSARGDTYALTFDIVDKTETPRKIIFSISTPTPTVTEGETARCVISVREVEERTLDQTPEVFFEIQKGNAGPRNDIDYSPAATDTWHQFGGRGRQEQVIEIPTYRTQDNTDDDRMLLLCRLGTDPEDTDRYRYDGDYAVEVEQHTAEIRILNIDVIDDDPDDTSRGPIWADNQVVKERGGSVSFDLRLNGELPEVSGEKVALVVDWSTTASDDGTATAGTDYTAASGTITFSPGGATSQRITIRITCDNAAERHEHFYVGATGELSDGTSVGGSSTVKITIESERSYCGGIPREVSIADGAATEGSNVEFVVSIPEALLDANRMYIDYATEDGTATAGEDYVAETGTAEILRTTTSTTIAIRTLSDEARDERETFRVRLTNARTVDSDNPRPVGFTDAVATGTIIEADPIGTEFRSVPTDHAQTAFTMELRLTAPLANTAAEVAAAITADGATVTATKLSELSWRLTVTPTWAAHVVIGLDHAALSGAESRAVAAIDPVTIYGRSTVSIGDAEADETDNVIVFTATLDEPVRVAVSVGWRTNGGTAIAGRDYQNSTGRLTFAAGETEATGRVRLFGTTEAEEDETFTVVLSDPRPTSKLVISTDAGTGTMTIHDGTLGVEIGQPATARTDGSNFTVPLSFRPGVDADVDADAVKNVLRIMDDGACSASVVGVTSAGDSKNFTAEINPGGQCHIEVGINEGTTLGDAVMQYTARTWILGPSGFSVEILNAEATEGDDRYIRFNVRLNAPAEQTFTVDYATTDGTGDDAARAGSDYTARSGTVTFTPPQIRQGRPEQVIEVPLRDDRTLEGTNEDPAERFSITLSNPSAGLSISDASATGTIHENDQAVWFTEASSRSGGGVFNIRVNFRVTDDSIDADALQRALRLNAGTVTRVYAETRGKVFIAAIDPPDERHIEIRLPRGTRVGRHTTLNDARYWALGPLELRVEDAQGTEGPNEAVRFAVRLSQAAREPVTVEYETEDRSDAGAATAGEDYTATSGTLTFAVGETVKYVDVPILDDDVDEGAERFNLNLKNAVGAGIRDGKGVGTIKNHDELPIALIARFGRATASQIVDQVETRIQGPPRARGVEVSLDRRWLEPASVGGAFTRGVRPGGAGSGPALGFENTTAGGPLAPTGTHMGLGERPGDDDPFGRSSFAAAGQHAGGTFSVWSQSAQTSFSGQQGAIALGGDVHTRMIGADYARGRMITGVAIGHTRATGDYQGVSTGEVKTSLTGLYPWLGYKATENLTVWAVAGRAGGSMVLRRPGSGATRTATSMTMVAGGGRNRIAGTTTMDLAVKADVLWVGTSVEGMASANGRLAGASAAVTRMRAGVEGARTYAVGRVALRPTIEMAFRQDGGDAETGSGLDAGAGIDVADAASGLGASIHLRRLLLHQAEGFEEHGVSFTMTYDPSPATPLGLRAEVTPSWGAQATGGAEGLWSGDALAYRGGHRQARGRSLDSRIGYGLRHGNRLVGTPRIGVRSSAYGRSWQVGYGLELIERGSMNFQLNIEAERRKNPMIDRADNGIVGRATVGWN